MSVCKLFLELEPLSSEPKLSMDDFFWAVPGVVGEVRKLSFEGEWVSLIWCTKFGVEDAVGEIGIVDDNASGVICMD